jgi:uncharacterized protein (TIGR02466 family)
MTEIVPFFSVPFAFVQNKDCAALHGELKKFFALNIAAAAASKPENARKDVRVFESRANLFQSTEPCAVELRDFCLSEVIRMACQLCGYDEATSRQLQVQHGAWFRITRRGGSLGLHNHPNSSWSGIYCVDPGFSDADKPDSGLISFVSPSQMSGMFMDASNTNVIEAFRMQPRMIKLEPGQLVVFPSWVLHEQRPYEGEGERVTVNFTCSMGLPGRRITPQ